MSQSPAEEARAMVLDWLDDKGVVGWPQEVSAGANAIANLISRLTPIFERAAARDECERQFQAKIAETIVLTDRADAAEAALREVIAEVPCDIEGGDWSPETARVLKGLGL